MIKRSSGFTLLELIVVLGGLGILSSLAIPNFLALLDSNKVGEIKALLNSAAADCLQKSRSETDPIIDDEIISDGIIEKIGYKIDRDNSILNPDDAPKCSMLWLEPTNGDKNESVRYNIGFSLSNGNLDKLASTEVPEKKPDCIKWAGKCKFSKAAKILEEYKEKVRAAKESCDLEFKTWKEQNNMNPSKFKQWDSSKGPDTCPKSPPEDENDTSYQNTGSCTTAGCDPGVPVWGLWDKDKGTGTYYYDENVFKKKRQDLIGVKCDKQIKDEYEATNFTNPSSDGWPLSECQNENYWFVEGENKGSEKAWKNGICEKNIKAKQDANWTDEQTPSQIEYCELEDGSPKKFYFCNGTDLKDSELHSQCTRETKSAKCEEDIDKKRESGLNGKYTNPTQGPPPCGKTVWFCNKTQQDTETEHLATACSKPTCKKFEGSPSFCTTPGWQTHIDCRQFCWD